MTPPSGRAEHRPPVDGSARVLHLTSSDDRRGAQVFARQLVDELGGPPCHTAVAVTGGSAEQRLDIDPLGRRRWAPAGFARLCAAVRRHDLLIAHGSSALLHGAAAASVARRPFIYRNIGDPAAWGAVTAAGLRIGLPLRRAAAVAALYDGARTHLIDQYGLDPSRVRTIPNGVRVVPPPDDTVRAAARARFGLDPSLTWLGSVGSLTEEKRTAAIIDAVAHDDGLGLVVAGDGPLADELSRRARRVAPGRVSFLGVVDDPFEVMAAIDVLVLASRTEGLPAVAIEAALCEVPVVATRVGGVPEVVTDGTTGVLVDDVDPSTLVAAVHHATRDRTRLGDAARRHCAARFTMPVVATAWAGLIDDVARGGQRVRPTRSR